MQTITKLETNEIIINKSKFITVITPIKEKQEIENILKNIKNKFGVELNWYIMTSPSNDTATKVYFENKDYFGYSKNKIKFFIQATLPIININGRAILDKPYKIKEGSNGNGDVFRAFADAGLLEYLKENNL